MYAWFFRLLFFKTTKWIGLALYLLNILISVASFKLNKGLISPMSKAISTRLGVVIHTCDPGSKEAEMRGIQQV